MVFMEGVAGPRGPRWRSLMRLAGRVREGFSFGREVKMLSGWRDGRAGTLRNEPPRKQRVVILGSGWAGYAAARTLSRCPNTETVLISPRSHFVFTPLLASTAVGTLEFRAAIEPVRRLGLAEFHQAWASGVDFENKVVRVEAGEDGAVATATATAMTAHADSGNANANAKTRGDEFDVPYDKLVVAVGCYSQTFGIEGVAQHAHFLRDVGDARAIRLRVLQA
ncbi:hypothetical protein E4U41_005218, partial [Claviceps citrina]